MASEDSSPLFHSDSTVPTTDPVQPHQSTSLVKKRQGLAMSKRRFEALMVSARSLSQPKIIVEDDETDVIPSISTMTTWQTQIKHLSSALQEKEAEVHQLKQQVDRHWEDSQQRVSLYPELEQQLSAARQESADAKMSSKGYIDRSVELEDSLRDHDIAMERLRQQKNDQLRTIVSQEIDLATHQLHYTKYAEQQEALEQDAMDQLFSADNGTPTTNDSVLALEEKYDCRVQQLISKLLVEKIDWERRYKEDRAECLERIDHLEELEQRLQAKVVVLEGQLANKMRIRVATPKPVEGMWDLARRSEQLESENPAIRKAVNGLRTEARQSKEMEDTYNTASLTTTASARTGNHKCQKVKGATPVSIDQFEERIYEQERIIHQLRVEKQEQLQRNAMLRLEAINSQLQIRVPCHLSGFNAAPMTVSADIESSMSNDEEEDWQRRFEDLKDILRYKEKELAMERRRNTDNEHQLLIQLEGANPAIQNEIRFFL